LIAPLYDSYGMPAQPNAGRSVWVPPGVWQDAYTGQRISGPLTLYNVQQPWERQPMWHRVGGFLVMATKAAHRVDDTDWTQLTLEAFVELGASSTVRDIYTAAQADVLLPPKVTIGVHSSNDTIVLSIAEFSKRLWTVRLHLPVGVRVTQCSHDMTVNHIAPIDETQASTFFPLRGAGSAPAHLAGLVAEAPLVTDRPIEVECSVQHV
jgi:alpha-glucosidase (family GH31 glycosyl hydrolase)